MNENDIPIDIQISKLQEWLVSRRHVSKEWQKLVLPIREKINSAIQDMPAHEGIVKLLSGTHINYFNCLRIIEILKETEADSKNIFGRYGSQRMKDWQEVIRLYEKDNLYLAEAAQILTRNINYEIPGLKKQLTKLDQTLAECDKKQEDYLKNQSAAKAEYNSICKEIGIKGDKIKSELCERLKELPDIYNAIAKKVPLVSCSINYYKLFSEALDGGQSVLPLLTYVLEKGNTTTYEWCYGEAPLTIQPDQLSITLDDEMPTTDADINIDFYDGVIDFSTETAIDFGEVVVEGNEEDIDWGDIGASAEILQEPLLGEICELGETGIVVEEVGLSGGVASGTDALTLLDNPTTREKFITDLLQLEAFVKMRLYLEGVGDNKRGGEEVLLSLEGGMQSKLTVDALAEMLSDIRTVISAVTSPAVTHLHNVKHSPRYVDSLSSQLRQKLSLCEKMDRLIAATKQKREDIRQQSVSLAPLLPLITHQTALLQEQIEQDISKKYKSRPVNLIGGVKG